MQAVFRQSVWAWALGQFGGLADFPPPAEWSEQVVFGDDLIIGCYQLGMHSGPSSGVNRPRRYGIGAHIDELGS